jgi:hypothetical protein
LYGIVRIDTLIHKIIFNKSGNRDMNYITRILSSIKENASSQFATKIMLNGLLGFKKIVKGQSSSIEEASNLIQTLPAAAGNAVASVVVAAMPGAACAVAANVILADPYALAQDIYNGSINNVAYSTAKGALQVLAPIAATAVFANPLMVAAAGMTGIYAGEKLLDLGCEAYRIGICTAYGNYKVASKGSYSSKNLNFLDKECTLSSTNVKDGFTLLSKTSCAAA